MSSEPLEVREGDGGTERLQEDAELSSFSIFAGALWWTR
jgi:hypothetical protein